MRLVVISEVLVLYVGVCMLFLCVGGGFFLGIFVMSEG